MSRRRFLLLAATLVALNTFFWLAQGGFALPGALIDRFFGPRMIRAEVIVGGPLQVNDFRLDRGVITTTAPGSITIRERDGTVVTISVSAGDEGDRRAACPGRLAAPPADARSRRPQGERAGYADPGRRAARGLTK